MMDGITILNTISHDITGFTWTIPAIVIFAILITIILAIFIWAFEECHIIYALFALIPLFGMIFVPLAGETVVDTYNTYQVIIDDSVSMNEFNSRYDILEVDGIIYTIAEKGIVPQESENK